MHTLIIAQKDGQIQSNNPKALDLVAYENPARLYSDIAFNLPETGPISLTVLDQVGKPVADLIPVSQYRKGEHTVRWKPGGNLPSGIYTVVLRFAGDTRSIQISYVK